MTVKELIEMATDNTEIVVMTADDWEIGRADFKDTIPEWVQDMTIRELSGSSVKNRVLVKVDDLGSVVKKALSALLTARLDDLNNGENVGNVLLNIEDFLAEVHEYICEL